MTFDFIEDFNGLLLASGRLDRLFNLMVPLKSQAYVKLGLENALKHLMDGKKHYCLVQAHAEGGGSATVDFTEHQLCAADEDFVRTARLFSVATNPVCFAVIEDASRAGYEITDTGNPLKPGIKINREDCVRVTLEWQDTASEWWFSVIRDDKGKLVKLSDRGAISARNGRPRWPEALEDVYLLPPATIPPEVRKAAIDFAANHIGAPIHKHFNV